MDTNHTPLGQPKIGRPWIRYGLGFLFIALAFLALITYQVYKAHAVATANAEANVKNLTMTLESKLEQALREAQWEVIKVATDIDMEAMRPANANRYRPQISRWLKSLASPIPGSLARRVFDANGDSLYSSNENEPAFNIADRNYFRQLQADPSIHVLFSDVFFGRLTRQPAIFAAKAVRDRNGAFLGIALNGIELSSLHRYFAAIELGTEGIVAVRRLDNGAMVVRYPGAFETTNKPAMDSPIRAALLKDGRPGSLEFASPVDGVRRIHGYRRMSDLPFFVLVGTSAKDYLAGWRQTTSISLLTSLLFLASLAAVFVRLARAEARREQMMALLQTSEQSYRTLIGNAADAIVVTGPDRRFCQVNARACAMFGYSSQEFIGLPASAIVAPAEVAQQLEAFQRIAAGEHVFTERQYQRKDGSVFAAELSACQATDGLVLGIIRDITERKQAEAQIQALAFTDHLTGLPNRRLLMDRLEQAMVGALRHGHQGALMFVDMDDFKRLNDSLGHDKGDQLLKQIAQRVLICVREGDTVARLGGDEFVVLLEDLSGNPQEAATQAETVGRKIHNALRQPYQLDSHGYHSSASIGITQFGGAQRESIEEPLKRAELAMYQAKAVGRDNIRFFEPEMRNAINVRANMETELHKAVAQAQFLLYYQAQVGRDARVTGVEALVRWQHPERGLIFPADFIPVAEESGLILPLGQWVLETTCKQLAAWAQRPEMAHLTISVNVSARQFRLPNFVEEVLAVLEVTGANPKRLKLELTESLLLDNMKDIITKMNALKASGVGFSLDDFGTGYSSLSYLKRLPLDELKIDQSFVSDILTDFHDAAIAKMVVALANSMDLAVIAEGVETEAQRDALAALGCYAYQGYLFSRPLPIEEFEVFAAKVSQGY